MMFARARTLTINLTVFGLLVALVEGGSSLVLFLRSVGSHVSRSFHAWGYTNYDPEVGWVSAPNVFDPDMYGPGRYLRTNDRGFRDDDERIHDTPASGRRRVICSGDSFTYGYGVSNHQTWCARLEAIAPWLDSVNLGQGGYGLDQMYLRYKRDAASLQHDLHLFAFITGDFRRMQWDSFVGYGKPRLKLEGGALAITNVPVPRRPFYAKWMTAIVDDLRALRMFRLLNSTQSGDAVRQGAVSHPMPDEIGGLVKKVFEETKRLADERGSKLVLVYLPTPDEYSANGPLRAWAEFLAREAKELGIPFIDVVAQHRDLSASEAATLFSRQYRHLSVKGNEYAANAVYGGLMGLPETSQFLLELQRRSASGAN